MFLLPSLNRPNSLRRFFSHYKETAATAPILVLLNREDHARNLAAYEALRHDMPAACGLILMNSNTLGGKLNEFVATRATWPPCPWLGYLQDDLVPRTQHWDRRIDALMYGQVTERGGNHFVTCDDAFRPGMTTGAWCMSAELLRAAGWYFPPELPHLFADDAWAAISAAIPGLRYHAADITLEHRHAMITKNFDDTTRAIYSEAAWVEARAAWDKWQKFKLPATVAKIREDLGII